MSKPHPFVKETVVDRSQYGLSPRIDRDFLMADFTQALADALGYPAPDFESARYSGKIECGDGLGILIRSEYGAKMGRVDIRAFADEAHKVERYQVPSFPSATYDASRPLDVLAKAIRKNIIDPARPLLGGLRDLVAERDKRIEAFGAMIADMETRFPGLSLKRNGERELTAHAYLNNGNGYISGTLGDDGRIHFERLNVNSADMTTAILALIASE